MESGGTISCSIIINNKLFGLISIHYLESRETNLYEFIFLKKLTIKLEDLILRNQINENVNNEKMINNLNELFIEELNKSANPLHTIMLSRYSLSRLTMSQGISIIIGDEICNTGIIPSNDLIKSLCKEYEYLDNLEIKFLDTLDLKFKDYNKNSIAGCVIIRLSKELNAFIFIYRVEINRLVCWGGDPRFNLVKNKDKSLTPRTSFKKWIEYVTDRCINWDKNHIKIINIVLNSMIDYFQVNSKELVLLMKNEIRQKLRKDMFNTTINFIDNIQTSIAIGIENNIQSKPLIYMNNYALEAFYSVPLNQRYITLEEFEKITDIKIKKLKYGEEIIKKVMTRNLGIRECKIKLGLIFEVISNGKNLHKTQVIEFTDITESQRIQNTLIVSRNKAELNIKLRDELYAKLSHELRNPLSVVIGYSDLLLRENTLDENLKHKISIILKSAKDLHPRKFKMEQNISYIS